MKTRSTFVSMGVVAFGLASLLIARPAVAASGLPPDPGPHGCLLSDPPLPVVHDSDTSHIGGNHCTYRQIGASGGSFFGAATAWSFTWCTPPPPKVKHQPCKPDGHIAGSGPVVSGLLGTIPYGDLVTVSVRGGLVSCGTPADT
ncbi:MAG: hypothetical protein ACYDH6_19010 [Acidimicrobiales bacterium]